MSYSIDFNETNGVIQVTYAGKVALAERRQAVEDVCTQYGGRRPLRILVDVSELEMVMTLDEQKAFGEFLASRPELADARVAVLYGGEPNGKASGASRWDKRESQNPNIIVDLVAFNNGYRLAQFVSLQLAAEWLMK
jgi:hypothetical protein